MQLWVYFEKNAPKKNKIYKKLQNSSFLEKAQALKKKLKLFGFQTELTVCESLHPATIKVVKKVSTTKGQSYVQLFPINAFPFEYQNEKRYFPDVSSAKPFGI